MRVAVVGTGIAGLGAAYLLSRRHEVEVFEQADYVGGHTNTIPTPLPDGRVLALDTGFIVHNRENYPNLIRLFDELGVRTQESEMSFSVSCARCGLEYSGARPWTQWQNLRSPAFLALLGEIVRFMRTAERAAARHEGETLAQFAARSRYSRRFRDHFLVPLAASIWSTSPAETLDFPASYAIRFFANHGMLRFRRFRWRTVTGGSQTYVGAILERLAGPVHTGDGVRAVRRDEAGVTVTTHAGGGGRFDQVVVATHPDQALAMLEDPSADEQRILGAFTYTTNETILHSDVRVLPRQESARGAWNYRTEDCRDPAPTLTLTYDLNRLQRLGEERHYLVTLNRGSEIAEDRIIRRLTYAHPRYTVAALRMQRELGAIAGARRTWYCGAWQGYGFHEDGFASAVRVARGLGVDW
jgi:predicted NAD/FAD-binding protein